MDMLRKGLLAIALIGGAAAAHADENTGLEFGVGVSRNDVRLDGADLRDSSVGYSGFIGYRFLPYLAVEAHLMNNGKAEWSAPNTSFEVDGRSYGASVLGSLPLGESGFAFVGRAGYLRAELESSFKVYAPPDPAAPAGFKPPLLSETRGEDTESAPIYGLGIRGMVDNAQVRLEYLRADLDSADIRMMQVSVAWLF